MKTRQISLVLVLALSTLFAVAQRSGDAKLSFGILGGINFQNLTGKDSGGDKLKNDMLLGYHAGVNVQIPIAPEFYFQPGLMFAIKGAKNSSTILGTTYTSTIKISYIEMPLNLVYKAQLGGGYFMLGFGPYVGYGIGGKAKTEGGSVSDTKDVVFKNTIETGDDQMVPYYKAFDAGANIFAGYQMENGIFAQLDTQLGLLNIKPKDNRLLNTSDKTNMNTGFGVSLGFRF